MLGDIMQKGMNNIKKNYDHVPCHSCGESRLIHKKSGKTFQEMQNE